MAVICACTDISHPISKGYSAAALEKNCSKQKTLFIVKIIFVIGASVFLAFDIATLGGTFTSMASNFRDTASGVDNSAFASNLYLRLQMLIEVLSGEYLPHFIFGETSYQTSSWHFTGSPIPLVLSNRILIFIVLDS